MRHVKALLMAPLLLAAAACTTTASAQPVGQPSPSYWPSQEAVMTAAEVIAQAGPKYWPNEYAGVSTDLPAASIVVARVPGGDIDAEVRQMAGAVPVKFTIAAHNAATVDRWTVEIRDKLDTDRAWWAARGVTVRSTWARPGTCVVVEIDNPGKHAAAFTARYPEIPLCVEAGGTAPALPAN